MDFNYFYGRGADQFAFYQIPKILITDEKFAGITMESKILYSLMLDRASLSAKNLFYRRVCHLFDIYRNIKLYR